MFFYVLLSCPASPLYYFPFTPPHPRYVGFQHSGLGLVHYVSSFVPPTSQACKVHFYAQRPSRPPVTPLATLDLFLVIYRCFLVNVPLLSTHFSTPWSLPMLSRPPCCLRCKVMPRALHTRSLTFVFFFCIRIVFLVWWPLHFSCLTPIRHTLRCFFPWFSSPTRLVLHFTPSTR